MAVLLGIDFGLKHIGLAIGQSISKTATPLTTLEASRGTPDWKKFSQIIEEWQPQQIVIGYPGDCHELKKVTSLAKNFANCIKTKYNIPVSWVDENLSTWEAKRRHNLHKQTTLTKKQIAIVNAEAACIILQQWLIAN